jgi:hypothetical protein
MIRIHNAETDEIVDREMTADELKEYEAEQSKQNDEMTAAETKASEKLALLERLGMTAEEAALLLS